MGGITALGRAPMGKKSAKNCVEFEDFREFYRSDGRIWIPNRRNGVWHVNWITPANAWKAVGFVLPIVTGSGEVVHFAAATLKRAVVKKT